MQFKAPLRSSGRSFVELDRDTFLARLAALVPPPHFTLIRYCGVLCNRHHLRERVLPLHRDDEPRQLTLFESKGGRELPAIVAADEREDEARRDPSPRRIAWARLLARVFAIDVTVCPRCGGPVRVQRAVTHADELAELLHGARPPPRGSPSGQLGLYGR